MPFQISIQPGGLHFSAADQTLLDAALAAGLSVPHGCRNGVCGACKGRVVHGEIDPGKPADHALPAAEREAGQVLLCCARARSDLVLEVPGAQAAESTAIRNFPARVQRLERLADDVMRVELQLPANESFRFRAGQYIDIVLADGARRSFSIANAPHVADMLELHVRKVEGGRFTAQVFSTLKARDILRCEGPFGDFWLRDSAKPAVMVATGTGFAPLKGIIEHAIHTGIQRQISLYWSARVPGDLYLDALVRNWEAHRSLPGFRYVPLVTGEAPGWSGRRGRVTDAVLADHADLSGVEVYACGLPAMVDTARTRFTGERKLPPDAFYADAFTFASTFTPKD